MSARFARRARRAPFAGPAGGDVRGARRGRRIRSIDPDQPAERNDYILETANPVLLLSTSRDGADLPAAQRVVALDELDVSRFSDAPVTDADVVHRCVRATPRT
ncbi:hypothetical protein GS426_10915 [Rhodococcus hoagii]|nr:hypothetical protein [Prescottella equi]